MRRAWVGLALGAVAAFASGCHLEWRGGSLPELVGDQSVPDYDALEEHRARQAQGAGAAALELPEVASWPGFRGALRDGVYREGPLLTAWPPGGPPLLWRQPAGGGYASFAVAGPVAFTIEQRRDQEVVVAYEVATGRERWTHGYPALFAEIMGGDGPRATPSYDSGDLFSLGATGELCALDAVTGELSWQRNVLADSGAENLPWGTAASPLLADQLVIASAGGESDGRSLLAYDRDSGELRWTALSDQQGYVSPMLVELDGVPQVLAVTAWRIAGLDLQDGTVLWDTPWRTAHGITCAQPVLVSADAFVMSSGYGKGAARVQVRRAGAGFDVGSPWQTARLKTRFNSAVYRGGYLYGLDEGRLVCLDAASGRRAWKGEDYGYGQTLLAGDHLLVLSADGELALVQASPEAFEEVARVPALTGRTWNVPALAAGRLLVRNSQEMACFDLRVAPPARSDP